MSQKSWKVKLILRGSDHREAIARAIQQWNYGVREICQALLQMRRGEFGLSGKAIWEHISRRTTDYHVVYWLTAEPKPTSNSTDVQRKLELTASFRDAHGFHARLMKARDTLGPAWKQAIHAAVQRIKSYQTHMQLWHEERKTWLRERADWQRNHPEYMNLRPLIETFNEEHGRTAGRWNRWHKWLKFLQRQEIIDWQSHGNRLVPVTADELRDCRNDRRRAVVRQLKILFKKNPQLEDFNRLHREFERNYLRFKRAPTFTLPSLPNRPDWPRFQRSEGWRNLDLQQQTIDLYLCGADDNAQSRWLTIPFIPDPRLKRLQRLAESYKPRKGERYDFEWVNLLGQPTFVQPQGLKLIQRRNAVYASISVTLLPVDSPIPVTQTRLNTVSKAAPYLRKVLRDKPPNVPLITCAIDLAVRHLGAVTVARDDKILARRLLHNRFFLPVADKDHAINIPTLYQLSEAKRALGRARSRTGGIRRGSLDFRRLRERYRNLKDDRIKKSVSAIFQYALHYGAHVVIFEDLKSLRPDAALDRGLNRAMQQWNRGALLNMAKQLADDYGLRVVTVGAGYTSRICARCGKLGMRFDQGDRRRSTDSALLPDRRAIRLNRLGHWFYCPHCHRRIHADLNASENLHRVFLGDWHVRAAKGGCAVNGEVMLYEEVERLAAKTLLMLNRNVPIILSLEVSPMQPPGQGRAAEARAQPEP